MITLIYIPTVLLPMFNTPTQLIQTAKERGLKGRAEYIQRIIGR